MKPLFSNVRDENDNIENEREDEDEQQPMLMIDKVRAVHEFFDEDSDGFLNYWELRTMQIATSDDSNDLGTNQYQLVCQALDCDPSKGIDIESLRLTYASGGESNIENDFNTVIRLSNEIQQKRLTEKERTDLEKSSKKEQDDDVIDVVPGKDIDIS